MIIHRHYLKPTFMYTRNDIPHPQFNNINEILGASLDLSILTPPPLHEKKTF